VKIRTNMCVFSSNLDTSGSLQYAAGPRASELGDRGNPGVPMVAALMHTTENGGVPCGQRRRRG